MENQNGVTDAQKSLLQKVLVKVKSRGMDWLFYCTALIAAGEGLFILCDLFTMLPPFSRLMGLTVLNTWYATPEMSNVYLLLLSAYCTGREAKRWLSPVDITAVTVEDLEEQVEWFSRGIAIVFSWQLLLIACVLIQGTHLISRLPHELFRVATQSLGLWTCTYISKSTRKGKVKRELKSAVLPAAKEAVPLAEASGAREMNEQLEKAARLSKAHRQMVIDHLHSSKWATAPDIMALCNLKDHQVYRLMESLEEKRAILSEGTGKHKRYRLNDENSPEVPQEEQEP